MPGITAFIIEPNAQDASALRRMLQDHGVEVTGVADNASEANDALSQADLPGVLFASVEEVDGTLFAAHRLTCPVILTGDPEIDLSVSMRAQGLRFLPKPFRNDMLDPLLAGLGTPNGGPSGSVQTYRKRFLVRQGQRWIRIDIDQVAWFRADGKLCFLRTWDNKRYLIDYSLEELTRMVDPEDFFRANRSYLVHANAVRACMPYFGGKLVLEMSLPVEGDPIIVSKEKARAFKIWLGK